MQKITSHIKQRMAKKNMAQLSIGAFSVELAKKFAKDPKNLNGYLRYHQLFLVLSKKEDKTKWFVEKRKILSFINQRLEKFGYEYVLKDIRVK